MEETKVIKFGNDVQRMTSIQIAEITGKNHFDVLKAIRKMEPAWEKINESKFSLVDYVDNKGEKRPCYSLDQEECLYIATKFNDEARAKLIKRWKELEIEKRSNLPTLPQTFAQALYLAAQQAEQIEEQQKLIGQQGEQIHQLTNAVSELQEKTSYLDRILASKSTVLVTSIAQDYGMSAKKFNILLHDIGVQRKVNKQWILYTQYLSLGYVHSKAIEIETKHGKEVKYNTEWTQKGRLFLYERLKKAGILPLIEK